MGTNDSSLIQQLAEAQRKAREANEKRDAVEERRWNATSKRLLDELKKTPEGMAALRSAKTIQRD